MIRLNSVNSALQGGLNPSSNSAPFHLDALHAQFSARATDWRSIASMGFGSLAYQSTKLAFSFTHWAAPILALSAEVTAFRASSQILSGTNLSDSWTTTFTHFACLKSMNVFTRGENPFVQQATQTLGLVAGVELCGRMGLSERSQEGLAERLVSAAVENVQLQAGGILSGHVTGHALHRVEANFSRGHELRLRSSSNQAEGAPHFRPLEMKSHLAETDNVFNFNWASRLRLWRWDWVDSDAIRDLANSYVFLGVRDKDLLFESIRKQVHGADSREKIGAWLEQLSLTQQVELVKELCEVSRSNSETLTPLLHFASLHPKMKPMAKSEVAHQLRRTQGIVAYEETFQGEFEGRILDAWAEIIPELPEIHIRAERTRANHLERFLKLARRPGYPGLRAALSLGTLILRAGWTRDQALLDAFFSYPECEQNALGENRFYGEYRERARILMQVMDASYQETVLERLWNSQSDNRWRSRRVFNDLVVMLPSHESQLRYYKRYQALLTADENEAVCFALENLDRNVLHLMDWHDRAALMTRIAARLADKDPAVVDATSLLFANHINSLGQKFDEVFGAVTRNVESVGSSGALEIRHIQDIIAALPKPRRPEFVRRVNGTVTRLLLNA